jgi:hypothetical protein
VPCLKLLQNNKMQQLLPLTLGLAVLLAAPGCRRADQVRYDVALATAVAERDALVRYHATPADSSLMPAGDVVVAVGVELLRDLLRAVGPYTRTIDRYRIEVDDVRLRFRDGLALVEIVGKASLAARPDVGVDIVLHGLLEFGGVGADRTSLDAHVEIVGIEVDVPAAGRLARPVARLANELVHRRAAEFDAVLGTIGIPLQLDEEFEIPGIHTADVTIASATLPLGFELADVRVLHGRVIIALRVDVTEPDA